MYITFVTNKLNGNIIDVLCITSVKTNHFERLEGVIYIKRNLSNLNGKRKYFSFQLSGSRSGLLGYFVSLKRRKTVLRKGYVTTRS